MEKNSSALRLWLNNIRFQKKMMLIYFVCIFIPMLCMNLFYFRTIKSRLETQWQNDMQYSLKAVRDSILNYVTQSAILIDRLILDESIYKELDFEYSGYINRMNFIERMNSVLGYAAPGLQLENVSIYTENPTLPGNGRIVMLDSQKRESQWYSEYIKTGKNMAVIAHGDEIRSKTVSIIRKANTPTKYQWLVKQDMSRYFLNNIFKVHSNIDAIFIMDKKGETVISYNPTSKMVQLIDNGESTNRRFLSAKEDLPIGDGWRLLAYTERTKVDVMRGSGMGTLFILIALNIIYATAFIIFITRTFVSRLKSLELCMEKMARSEFEPIDDVEPGQDEIGLLTKGVNNAVRMINSLINDVFQARMRELEIDNEKRRAELSALQSQINPHFIYNLLETMRMESVGQGYSELATIIKYVSRIFRRSVNQSADLITISEELEFIREYSKIEEYRFGEELTISIDVDDTVLMVLVPKLSLQVLLENACIHGVERISGEKRIHIKITGDNNRIYGSVADNGKGMSIEKIERILADNQEENSSVGLQNLHRRLNLYYGNNFEFKMENMAGGGFKVSFNIPCEPEGKL